MAKRALITGITGQDGSYLAEFLLANGYEVFGMTRRSSTDSFGRIAHLAGQGHAALGRPARRTFPRHHDLDAARPDEIYNLAAQSFVPTVMDAAGADGEFTAVGVDRVSRGDAAVKPDATLLPGVQQRDVRQSRWRRRKREKTPFYPRSPYGVAKVYGHWITVNYRESYDLFACSGILFNHESAAPRREFVTRKMTDGVARIKLGLPDKLRLGNLDAQRDWGFAGDYVRAMWLMLQQDEPDDFVIATGETRCVQEFVEIAFDACRA